VPLADWPVWRQLLTRDIRGLGATARSSSTDALTARTSSADAAVHSVQSVCPYCAVGCGQLVSVRDGRITNIEGDPASPISRGRLCPKGSATYQLVTGAYRPERVLYRRPGGTEWEPIGLDDAMDMVAARVKSARDAGWDAQHRRTLAFAHLGGATLDNEENYLIKKLFTALGAIQIENQARI
jgi:formate dehydrogenase major subunit